jgi:hypothetical protein
MKTRLDRLLENIDPAVTLDRVSTRVDEALNSFHVGSGSIETWGDFCAVLTAFYRHVENGVLRIRLSPSPDMDWGRCSRLLIREYGPNGDKAAFEMVRTGTEGGLYAVLRRVASQMTEECVQRETAARISHFWEGLSTDEKLATSEEYLDRYGHLLPSELTEGSAARVRANFLKVLEEHPRMVRRLRNIGRGR